MELLVLPTKVAFEAAAFLVSLGVEGAMVGDGGGVIGVVDVGVGW